MNPHETFAELTKKIEALACRLDRLIGRRKSLLHEFETVRQIVVKRHRDELSAAILLSDFFSYREQLRTDEHKLVNLLQSFDRLISEDQVGGEARRSIRRAARPARAIRLRWDSRREADRYQSATGTGNYGRRGGTRFPDDRASVS